MTVIATALKHLLAAGVTGDALVTAISELEAAAMEDAKYAPRPRSKGAERQARYRDKERHKASQSVTSDGSDVSSPPPNDIYSNPPPTAKAVSPTLAERVVEAWNAGPKAKGATGAVALDANRRKMLSVRVREHGEQAIFDAIRNVAASPFHCGTNDRNWKANLGWLLKSPENFLKALEMTPIIRPGGVGDLLTQAASYGRENRQAIQ